MNLDQIHLGHAPLTNLEDFNEYGLSSHSDSEQNGMINGNGSMMPLRKTSNTLSKSAVSTMIPMTMDTIHSMDEDFDSNSNFQSSSSSESDDDDPLTASAASLSATPKPDDSPLHREGTDKEDEVALFRQYSARQRIQR